MDGWTTFRLSGETLDKFANEQVVKKFITKNEISEELQEHIKGSLEKYKEDLSKLASKYKTNIEENIDNICKYFRNYIISLKEELDEKEK